MTEHNTSDGGVVFEAIHGIDVAFMGTLVVGLVRAHPVGWTSYLTGDPARSWRTARDVDDAKAALRRHVAQWYDALHTPLSPGQGERLARDARVG